MILLFPNETDVYKQYAERVNNNVKKDKVVKASSRITKSRQVTNDDHHEFQNSYSIDGKGKYIDFHV